MYVDSGCGAAGVDVSVSGDAMPAAAGTRTITNDERKLDMLLPCECCSVCELLRVDSRCHAQIMASKMIFPSWIVTQRFWTSP